MSFHSDGQERTVKSQSIDASEEWKRWISPFIR